jgi:hypothetical protein
VSNPDPKFALVAGTRAERIQRDGEEFICPPA